MKTGIREQWWFLVGIGAFLVPMAFYEFARLTDLETHGGSLYVSRYDYLMYQISGRWGVLIFLLLLAGGSFAMGIRRFLKRHVWGK